MNLEYLLKDIEMYRSKEPKEELLSRYIQERLTKSINIYYKELEEHMEYALARTNSERADLRMLRQLNYGYHRDF